MKLSSPTMPTLDKLAWRALRRASLLVVLLIPLLLRPGAPTEAATQLAAVQCGWFGQRYTDFYTPPNLGAFSPDRLGEILRVEFIRSYTAKEVADLTRLPFSAHGARVFRVLYLSQAPSRTAQAVSGLVIVPTGAHPPGGFPLMAYGHGTTGMADSAAPSRFAVATAADLLPWIARGYVVSATDYAGLGTPGLHPYLVGEAAAFSMLDSARAALRFCDSAHGVDAPIAANRIFLVGHSQGGHAALFARQAWARYAPELKVLGTVALAPVTELRLLVQRMAASSSPMVDAAALAMYAYSRYYGAPTDLSRWLKEPYATDLPDRAEKQAIAGLSLWLGFDPRRVFQPRLLEALHAERWKDLQPWTGYLDTNTPGAGESSIPLLLIQGENDDLIPFGASERFAQRLCQHDQMVKLSLYPGVGHSVTDISRPEALWWMAGRLAGLPAPSNCDELADGRMSTIRALGANTIDRALDPVILKGSTVPLMLGAPVNNLFVYTYHAGVWTQRPSQVDELTSDGKYTAAEDSVLDANDEIAFMARDLGDQAPPAAPGRPAGLLYEITVADPRDTAKRGWAYVVKSSTLKSTAAQDYVSFDASLHRIDGTNYQLGFATPKGWADYLTLGASTTDILDRTKLRVFCSFPGCPLTEEAQPNQEDDLVKDGPVRVILRNGRLIAYGGAVQSTTAITIPQILAGDLRFSTDFSPAVSGSTFYNAAVPGGVTADGTADTVPATPFSPWWQLSTTAGTVIQVSDTSTIGGTPTNYYLDSAATDSADTGDKQHYADAGGAISDPNLSFEYVFAFYFLPTSESNVGEGYAANFFQPLVATAQFQGRQVFLPLVRK